MNLYNGIEPGTKEEMNVIIENPRGSKNKYEVDKKLGIIALDRVLHTAQDYPVEYGYVPQTHWDDGDALDVILLSTYPFTPGVLVKARPIGVLKMVDGGDNDDKVLGVPVGDPRFAHIKDVADVNPHTLKEIEHFFAVYKQIQKKEVIVKGFEGRTAGEAAFERACQMYAEKK
ncbi:MAG TPA: inorganic diphosphatase [Candidatus Paceibacterota bacterium]|nr:inorganic diphosphatase [Candidatus Paceibacterota bacterium]